jgi:hypothetical protein
LFVLQSDVGFQFVGLFQLHFIAILQGDVALAINHG